MRVTTSDTELVVRAPYLANQMCQNSKLWVYGSSVPGGDWDRDNYSCEFIRSFHYLVVGIPADI